MTTLLCLLMGFEAMAYTDFPFGIELGCEQVERICYSGHGAGAVRYADGIAVEPDISFSIEGEGVNDYTIEHLSATVTLIYENDDCTGCRRETLKTYPEGSLSVGTEYYVMSDNITAGLDERDLLYSGPLSSVILSFKCSGRETAKKTLYLYVCDEESYSDYLQAYYENDG